MMLGVTAENSTMTGLHFSARLLSTFMASAQCNSRTGFQSQSELPETFSSRKEYLRTAVTTIFHNCRVSRWCKMSSRGSSRVSSTGLQTKFQARVHSCSPFRNDSGSTASRNVLQVVRNFIASLWLCLSLHVHEVIRRMSCVVIFVPRILVKNCFPCRGNPQQ